MDVECGALAGDGEVGKVATLQQADAIALIMLRSVEFEHLRIESLVEMLLAHACVGRHDETRVAAVVFVSCWSRSPARWLWLVGEV